MATPTRGVPIELGGKKRHLRLNFGALAAMEQETEKLPVETLTQAEMGSPKAITVVLWASMLHEDPEVKVEDVVKWLNDVDIDRVATAITQAAELANGKENGAKAPDAEGNGGATA